jgi:hypothetical protein
MDNVPDFVHARAKLAPQLRDFIVLIVAPVGHARNGKGWPRHDLRFDFCFCSGLGFGLHLFSSMRIQ